MPGAQSDASQSRGWAFTIDGEATYLRPTGRLDCTDGQVLHAWCSDGLGVAWRSAWEVQQEVAAGTLVMRAVGDVDAGQALEEGGGILARLRVGGRHR